MHGVLIKQTIVVIRRQSVFGCPPAFWQPAKVYRVHMSTNIHAYYTVSPFAITPSDQYKTIENCHSRVNSSHEVNSLPRLFVPIAEDASIMNTPHLIFSRKQLPILDSVNEGFTRTHSRMHAHAHTPRWVFGQDLRRCFFSSCSPSSCTAHIGHRQ